MSINPFELSHHSCSSDFLLQLKQVPLSHLDYYEKNNYSHSKLYHDDLITVYGIPFIDYFFEFYFCFHFLSHYSGFCYLIFNLLNLDFTHANLVIWMNWFANEFIFFFAAILIQYFFKSAMLKRPLHFYQSHVFNKTTWKAAQSHFLILFLLGLSHSAIHFLNQLLFL